MVSIEPSTVFSFGSRNQAEGCKQRAKQALKSCFSPFLPFEWSKSDCTFIIHSQKSSVRPCPLVSPSYCPRVTVLTQCPWGCAAPQTSSVPYINHRLSSFNISLRSLGLSHFTLFTCGSSVVPCGAVLNLGSQVTCWLHQGVRIKRKNVHNLDYITPWARCWEGN